MNIDKKFDYHKPTADGLTRMTTLRKKYSELLDVLRTETYASREQSLAITALEESATWANKAIVFNDPAAEVPVEAPAPVAEPLSLLGHVVVEEGLS